MKECSTLRSRRQVEGCMTAHRRHAELRAECELRERYENFSIKILTVSLEPSVIRDLEHDVHVAAWATTRPRVADAAKRHVLPGRDACRNVDVDLALAAQSTFATTLFARRLHDTSLAVTRRTWSDSYELAEKRFLRATHFALASAG